MPIIRGRGVHSYRDYKKFAVCTRVTIVSCPLTLETPFPWRERAKSDMPARQSNVRFRVLKRTLLGERVTSAPDPKRTFRLFGRRPPRCIYVGRDLAPNDVDVTAQIIQLVREG